MQYTYLGRSGMRVSRICLGTWNFGSYTDETEAFAIMDAAVDAGVNFFDTANHYPDFVNCGRSEEIIGRWFAQGGRRREKVVLATKVYQPMKDPVDGPNDDPGLSIYKIRRHAAGSLRRLQTDHIELYQMHHVDHRARWGEVWEAFESLVRAGTIDYVGSSNFAAWQLALAQGAAERRNFFGLASEQHRYSLACRLPELEVLPAARHLGIGVMAYSPLAGGLLAGKIAEAPEGSRRAGMKQHVADRKEQFDAWSALCAEMGHDESHVALAWVLSHPAMTSVVVGPRTVEQFKDSLAAVDVTIGDDTRARLDELFPGPGGPAPEAYAW